jgi:pimeloyl-ACP methyl ester carboxylesterase
VLPDLTERLHEIEVPLLLVWATREALSSIGVGRAIEARVRRGSLVTFDSDDHWVARQFADQFAAIIESFVERET